MAKLDLTSKGFDEMAMSGFDPSMFMSGSGSGQGPFGYQPGSYANIFHGLFGQPQRPYQQAQHSLEQNYPQAQQYQMPFMQAGQNAIPQFQNWLSSMQDPSSFINTLMGNYQESPYAQFQQQQGLRTAQNVGSATGTTGSTPLMQFAQQNARDISSQDMGSWLQNVLGVNSQYGAGQQSLINGGQNAANSLSELARQFMAAQAGLEYGKGAAREGKTGSLIGGLTGLFGL